MFCTKCGNQVSDQAKFCPKCGQPQKVITEPVQPVQPTQFENYEMPQEVITSQSSIDQETFSTQTPKKGFSKKAIIAGIVAAVLVVSVGATAAIISSSPEVTVAKAFANTFSDMKDEATDMTSQFPIVDLLSDYTKEQYSFEFLVETWFGDIEVGAYTDIKNNQVASYAEMYGEEAVCTFSSDRFTISHSMLDDVYGLELKDFASNYSKSVWEDAIGLDEDELPDLSNFDFSDNIEKYNEIYTDFYMDCAKIIAANVEIEKDGSETIKINKESIKADTYAITLDDKGLEKSLEDILELIEDSPELTILFAIMLGESPDDVIDELEDGFDYMIDNFDEMEMTVYIYKGRVVCIEGEIEKDTFTISLNPTGNIWDFIQVVLEIDGMEVVMDINAGITKDVFTFEFEGDAEGDVIGLEIEYDFTDDKDNFVVTSWENSYEQEFEFTIDTTTKDNAVIEFVYYGMEMSLEITKGDLPKGWFDQDEEKYTDLMSIDEDDDLFRTLFSSSSASTSASREADTSTTSSRN